MGTTTVLSLSPCCGRHDQSRGGMSDRGVSRGVCCESKDKETSFGRPLRMLSLSQRERTPYGPASAGRLLLASRSCCLWFRNLWLGTCIRLLLRGPGEGSKSETYGLYDNLGIACKRTTSINMVRACRTPPCVTLDTSLTLLFHISFCHGPPLKSRKGHDQFPALLRPRVPIEVGANVCVGCLCFIVRRNRDP